MYSLLVLLSALAAGTVASPIGGGPGGGSGGGSGGQVGRAGPGGAPGGGFGGGGRPGGGPGASPTTAAATVPAAAPTVVVSDVSVTVSATATDVEASPTLEASATASDTSVTPTLPTVPGASTQLPEPTGLSLKYIGLGHGVQNYTCSAEGAAGTSTGALAVLYDITPLFPGTGADAVDQATWDGLSSSILSSTPLPLNLVPGSAVDVANPPFPAPAGVDLAGKSLPFLAQHYFDSTSRPTFDLSGSPGGEFFVGAKSAAVNAPSSAADVAWLQLTAVAGASGVQDGYRVVTAGGVSSLCTSVGQQISVAYAAQYWFFD